MYNIWNVYSGGQIKTEPKIQALINYIDVFSSLSKLYMKTCDVSKK